MMCLLLLRHVFILPQRERRWLFVVSGEWEVGQAWAIKT